MTKDYALNMIDGTGRTLALAINGDSITEMVATGMSPAQAAESVEGNAFANAIARGDIGADAWIV